jgi:uncharacterized protein YbjT (DUF2867 family)
MLGTRSMKVVITGANSAVGQAILRQSDSASSMTFVAAVRSDRAARELEPLSAHIGEMARIAYGDSKSLRTAFSGALAVIHLAGVLVEQPGSTYEQANVDTTRSVVEAAKEVAVEKLVYVSAIGADEASANRYWRSKGLAEAIVRGSGLPYTVLRAPLLLGPGTEASAALKRNVSRRTAMLIGGGHNVQQPIDVADLARAALVATRSSAVNSRTFELVGPVAITEREILDRAARIVGRHLRVRSIPKKLISLAAAIRRLTGRPGFSQDALEVITADTRLDPTPATMGLGIELTGLDEMIRRSVS